MKKVLKRLLVVALMLFSFVGLAACNNKSVYDSITNKCKLTKDYSGKDFLSDGIGEASLVRTTDGDTATFRLSSGTVVTIRFHGIDTPESTGAVEKWGKSASKFVESILKDAESFVLEATAKPAEHDSYGVRYLGYVWYRNSVNDSWKNLNLQVVENGYSENKCFQDIKYPYYSYFADAQSFAKKKKLHIWSNDEDPYYTTEAAEVTIKEIRENKEIYYNEEENSGAKVRIQAFITDVEISQSGTYTYTAMQYDENDNAYVMNIYAGYVSSGIPSYIRIGGLYSITGTLQQFDGALQISGLTYVPLETGGDYLYAINANYYCIFDSSIEYKNHYGKNLYGDVTITQATVNGNTLTITGTTIHKSNNVSTELTTMTFNIPVADGFSTDGLIGRTFSATGLQKEKNVITVVKNSDFKLK